MAHQRPAETDLARAAGLNQRAARGEHVPARSRNPGEAQKEGGQTEMRWGDVAGGKRVSTRVNPQSEVSSSVVSRQVVLTKKFSGPGAAFSGCFGF